MTFQCRGLQSIAFYHGMFPWLGVHLLECDGDYRVEMLKQQITGTDRCPRSSIYSFIIPSIGTPVACLALRPALQDPETDGTTWIAQSTIGGTRPSGWL